MHAEPGAESFEAILGHWAEHGVAEIRCLLRDTVQLVLGHVGAVELLGMDSVQVGEGCGRCRAT